MFKLTQHKADRPLAGLNDPDEICIYAIGDIHGRFDLLTDICARIDTDIQRHRERGWLQVFLGDYVDRGPHSSAVITLLAERSRSAHVICLRGNHEAALLQFLDAPETLAQWRQFGGLQTLMSYGLTPSANPGKNESARLAQQLRQIIPSYHLEFLESLRTSYSVDRYFFVHAGVRPGVPLDQQREEDLLWIRDDFLLSKDDFGKVIVHGHTPVLEPELLFNRINIDTGAYATGRLSCVKLVGQQATLL
jgi:serine/threonine protein phosphatase 1